MFVGRTVYKTRERHGLSKKEEKDKRRAVGLIFDAYVRHREVKAGQAFKTTDGAIYRVGQNGAAKRVGKPEKLTKKERRKARRVPT